MGLTDCQEEALLNEYDAAYKEIVLRHGTPAGDVVRVTLDQVMETLLSRGWSPPVPRPRPKVKEPPLKFAEEKLETCQSCKETVNPIAAPFLCRHTSHHCPYKAKANGCQRYD